MITTTTTTFTNNELDINAGIGIADALERHETQQERAQRQFASVNPFEAAYAQHTLLQCARWRAHRTLCKARIAEAEGRYSRAIVLYRAWSQYMRRLQRRRVEYASELICRFGESAHAAILNSNV